MNRDKEAKCQKDHILRLLSDFWDGEDVALLLNLSASSTEALSESSKWRCPEHVASTEPEKCHVVDETASMIPVSVRIPESYHILPS